MKQTVLGIGVDLLAMDRVRQLVLRRGIGPFARRILSKDEQSLLLLSEDKVRFLQSRFAVKEALFKATSCYRRLSWSDVSLLKEADGRPYVKFNRRLNLEASVSLSHDQDYLVAMAIVFRKELEC